MERKLRVGHIGTRHDHSAGKLECVRKLSDIYEVIGVAEEDPEQRKLVLEQPPYRDLPFLSVEQMIDAKPDCVLVEGFEYDLPRVALLCVENGIPVHIDKPAGMDLPLFRRTLQVASAKGLPVQMAYMYRYNPAVRECLKYVREGRLGDILAVTAVMNTGHSAFKRQWLSCFGQGGIMFFLGCHMVDLVHLMQGVPDEIVPFLSASGAGNTTAVDQGTAILRYPGGTSIVQANACEIGGYGRRQLVVSGTRGTFEIRPMECPIQARWSDAADAYCYEDRHVDLDIPTVARDARYDEMMTDFAAMVRGQKENPFTYEYELQTQQMLLACCGQPVDFHAGL